jgi:outer membrane lipoprotein-sorting protein
MSIFMRKALHYSFFVVSLGLIISSVSVSQAKGQNVLGEILRRMDVHNKALQSVHADVTMVKTNVQLGVSDTTYGNTSYLTKSAKQASAYVRIDWTRPVEEQISVKGDDYELYRPRLNQVIVGKVNRSKNSASAGGALAFMNMSKAQLQANYSIAYLGEEQISGGTRTWHLQLTPNAPTSYKLAELWVDVDGMPRQAKITEPNNDTTAILLSNIQKNLTLKKDIFNLNYDKKKVKTIRA